MKKLYLLLAATLITSVAIAKVDYNQKHSQMKNDRPVMASFPDGKAIVTTETAAPDNMPIQLKAQPQEGETFYCRPHGSFYVGYNPMVSRVYYSPYLYMPNFRDVTFLGTKVADWSYQKWDRTVSARPWITVEDQQDLTLNFITETDSVPYIYDESGEFCMIGHNSSEEEVPLTLYAHNDIATRLASNANGSEGWFASPKYWASRDRDLNYTGITRYLNGALDSDGGTTAFWFGKNYTGWNACAIYCEKPENPYVLRGAAIRYAFYLSPQPIELTMRIYKVGAHEPREMSFGEMIAEAKATLPASPDAETSGGLYFTFTEVDEEYGLVSEITPEIDDEIYVVLSGYDNDAIGRFALPLSADTWDEGIGETGYNIQLDDEGNIGTARSLNAMSQENDSNNEPLIHKTLGIYLFRLRKWMRKHSCDAIDSSRPIKDEYSAAPLIPGIPPFGERFYFYEKIQGGAHFFAFTDYFVDLYKQFSKTPQIILMRKYLLGESHWKYESVIETILFAYFSKFGKQYLSEALFCISSVMAQHRYESRAIQHKINEFAQNKELVMMIDQASSPSFFLAECLPLIKKSGKYLEGGDIKVRFYEALRRIFKGLNDPQILTNEEDLRMARFTDSFIETKKHAEYE